MPDIITDIPLIMLTPQQAASHVNVSRGTIMNSIKDGSLVAFRDNRNRWQIRSDELSKWLSLRTGNSSDNDPKITTIEKPTLDENSIRLAVLEAELKNKDQRILDLEQDRDSWKEQAQELAKKHIVDEIISRKKYSWWRIF